MKNNKFKCHQAVKTTLDVISGKWKPLILWHLLEKKMRFNELEKELKPISQKVLTKELRDLEKSAIINRRVYLQVPPKVEYEITKYGMSLQKVLESLADWGSKHNKNNKK